MGKSYMASVKLYNLLLNKHICLFFAQSRYKTELGIGQRTRDRERPKDFEYNFCLLTASMFNMTNIDVVLLLGSVCYADIGRYKSNQISQGDFVSWQVCRLYLNQIKSWKIVVLWSGKELQHTDVQSQVLYHSAIQTQPQKSHKVNRRNLRLQDMYCTAWATKGYLKWWHLLVKNRN